MSTAHVPLVMTVHVVKRRYFVLSVLMAKPVNTVELLPEPLVLVDVLALLVSLATIVKPTPTNVLRPRVKTADAAPMESLLMHVNVLKVGLAPIVVSTGVVPTHAKMAVLVTTLVVL